MRIAKRIEDLVGNTPLLRINTLSKLTGTNIIGKLEYHNPLASVKDRIAVAMIDAAEKDGLLRKGGLIVEPTSGNTGVGLAFVAAVRGYKLILTMPETMSIERRKLLKALGADLVLTPGEKGMKGAVAKAEEIIENHDGAYMPQQFKNPANPEIHYRTTAEEIWRDTEGTLDIFIAGVGTGGTITGCGHFFKKKNKSIHICAVEPDESAVLSGEQPGQHKIQGIGAGFVPDILDTESYDEVVRVSSLDSAEMVRRIAKEEGVLLGISSGAALTAAYQLGKREENKGKTIIVILPSSGERYLSTWIYSD